jgi:hypothetical protein
VPTDRADWPAVLLAIWLLFSTLVVGVWDVMVAFRAVPGRTVSSYLTEWGERWLPGVLLLGIVLGHLLWPPDRSRGPGNGG